MKSMAIGNQLKQTVIPPKSDWRHIVVPSASMVVGSLSPLFSQGHIDNFCYAKCMNTMPKMYYKCTCFLIDIQCFT